MTARTGSILLLMMAATMVSGCVQRTVTITSDPTGALAYVNGREIGRTPVDFEFEVYGEYDVRLLLDGYEPLATSGRAKTPWWDAPGPDLVADISPRRDTVHYDWHYVLTPTQNDPAGLIDRARELRSALDTPMSPAHPE